MRKLVLTVLASGTILTGWSQSLFTYGNNSVSKDEFLRVYQKNSLNKKPDFSETALREYLDLYTLFRMKVREAELQKIDTLQSIDHELSSYRKQLAKNYLTDEEVENKLMREAYDRMKEEVKVQHILILSSATSPSADTVEPYKKIDSIYNAITKKKADFSEMAKKYSDDRGTKEAGGELGYLTALQTVYAFENAMYNTPVGKVSQPFRTQFGYHLVKVLDRRPARGEVKVAQVLVIAPPSKGEEGVAMARKRVDSVYADMKKGVSFEQLVERYSDDNFSKGEKGVLPAFGVGKMVPAFEDAAFALKNPGDVTPQPVKTEYGFHVIKLIEKNPIKPYDSLRSYIKKKVENDSRSQLARDIYVAKIKSKYGFKEYAANIEEVAERMSKISDTGKTANQFKAEDYKDMTKPVFKLDNKEYSQFDMIKYAENLTRGRLMGPKKAVVKDIYNNYVTMVVNDLQEHKLVDEYPEFKNLMEEYRDGIMLFELMDRNVWGKATRDTTGLKKFYEANKGKWMWEPGFRGTVYRFKNEKAMKEGVKMLAKKDVKDEDITKKINSDSIPDAVTIQRGYYEFSKFKDVPQSAIVKGKASDAVKNNEGVYVVAVADDVFTSPNNKTLEEAKGYVVAEYQDYLEKQWNEEMRKKYPVKLNESVFKSMVK